MPFLRDPPVSERPHSSAGSAVNAPLIFAGSVSIKEPEPRNSRRNAVTVPVTPPCPNYFISLLRAYILYLYPSNPWAHLALGWVAFLKRHTDDAVVEYQRRPTSARTFAAAHGHLGSALTFEGQSARGI